MVSRAVTCANICFIQKFDNLFLYPDLTIWIKWDWCEVRITFRNIYSLYNYRLRNLT